MRTINEAILLPLETRDMCIQQETLYACGHKSTFPTVIFDDEASKCPCMETILVDSQALCWDCHSQEERKVFVATNSKAAEIEEEEEVVGEEGVKNGEKDGQKDEY